MSAIDATGKKAALVTGAGKKRVGREVARQLAMRGYNVAIHYNSSSAAAQEAVAEMQSLGVDAVAVGGDVADERAVRKVVDATLDRFGRIDALVTCAAIWERKPLEEVTAADVRRHFDCNTLGTFLFAQMAGLAMTRQTEGGAIVTVGDWAVARPYLNYAAYFPSKGAIIALTRSLAVELAARNPRVRVNCVLPGPVLLPADLSTEDRTEALAGTLVKREGSPANIAAAVIGLIENNFITGVCLPIDGGRTINPS